MSLTRGGEDGRGGGVGRKRRREKVKQETKSGDLLNFVPAMRAGQEGAGVSSSAGKEDRRTSADTRILEVFEGKSNVM